MGSGGTATPAIAAGVTAISTAKAAKYAKLVNRLSNLELLKKYPKLAEAISDLRRRFNAPKGLGRLGDSMMSLMRKIPSRGLTSLEKLEFKTFMKDSGVLVEFGRKAEDGSDILRFMPVGPGRAQLNLPDNATWYQALHESGHFYDWIARGKPSRADWLDIPYHEREKSVYDWIKGNYWDDLTLEQQSDAFLQWMVEYQKFLRGE